MINQELTRLDGMVGKLIELSKIESRHAAFERRAVAVADIVSDALAAFETRALRQRRDAERDTSSPG